MLRAAFLRRAVISRLSKKKADHLSSVSIFFPNVESDTARLYNVNTFEPMNGGDSLIEAVNLIKEQFATCRKLLAAIGDETRQLIITVLMEAECNGLRVGDITAKTHLSRPAVSHHLKILLDTEVVGVSPEGTKHFYYLNLGGEWPTLVALIGGIEELRSAYCWEE
jgi:ArsR family transcriptional regulator